MARNRPTLTTDLANQIAAFIRAGGFPHVAAEAAGVPRAVFDDWLRRGRPPYGDFARAILQAMAQARLTAEIAALEGKPLDWLKSGPGKETAGAAGWTGPARPTLARTDTADLLADPRIQELIGDLLQSLADHPEARLRAASRVAGRIPGKWQRLAGFDT